MLCVELVCPSAIQKGIQFLTLTMCRQGVEVKALIEGFNIASAFGIRRIIFHCDYYPIFQYMKGMKRPYPFSMETPPAPNFHLKYPPPYVVTPNPVSRINEAAAASYNNRSAVSTDLDINRNDREIPTKVSPREEVKENRGLNGDFLSLGPLPHAHAVGSRNNSLIRYNNNSNVSEHQHQGLFDFAPQPTRIGWMYG